MIHLASCQLESLLVDAIELSSEYRIPAIAEFSQTLQRICIALKVPAFAWKYLRFHRSIAGKMPSAAVTFL